ncbi:PASTA domain-containing protein, partial [Streptomyces massasporeus]|uniref:PASTA domain-containing protein n=1 Tax=Streptomyces massasporeus TaxID=67324 RepID=UPI0033EF82A1
LRADSGAGATSMLPPMNPDDGGYGYDDRPDRRRGQQRKSNTSTILLVVAGILVLVGAILIGRWAMTDGGDAKGGGSGPGVGSETVVAPDFVGKTRGEAEQLAAERELRLSFEKKPCADQSRGKICDQDPAAGKDVAKGSTVGLVVSTGAPKVAVPSVTGLDVEEARDKLEADTYAFDVRTESRVSPEAAGIVLEQDPVTGTEVQKGTTITLVVAEAEKKPREDERQKSTVPDVVGMTCQAATAQMTANGLVGACTEQETGDPNRIGKVISTTPGAHQQVDENSTVRIVVGKARRSEQVTVPDVDGQDLGTAQSMLRAAGLEVGEITGSRDPRSRVLGSTPPPGTRVDKGTHVALFTADRRGDDEDGEE